MAALRPAAAARPFWWPNTYSCRLIFAAPSLPFHNGLTEEEQSSVADAIGQFEGWGAVSALIADETSAERTDFGG